MNTILFLTDFSETARKALFYGLALHQEEECTCYLVHTTYLPYSKENESASPVDVRTEEARTKLQQLRESIDEAFPGHRFQINTDIINGEVTPVAKQLVEQHGIDLIVMGTHGMSAVAEVFLGSNTAALIRQVDCPVLAVPMDYEWEQPSRMVLAWDEDQGLMEYVLEPFVKLAKRLETKVTVVHIGKEMDPVHSGQFSNIKRYTESLDASYLTAFHDDVFYGLDGFVKSSGAQILGIINQKLGFIGNLFHKSLTRQMAFSTDIPLLIMSHKK